MSRSTGSTRPARSAAAVLALGLGLLTACSDDAADVPEAVDPPSSAVEAPAGEPATPSSSAASPDEAESETITATEGEFFIELDEDTFSPGSYTVEVTNEGNASHDLVVERDGEDVARTETIPPGGTATLEVTLEEGEYVFYCSIGNHRAMGMETPVTVTA